jgi:hypothetical protein
MEYFYTKGWFRAHKRPLAMLTEQEAKLLHGKGKVYTVLVDSIERPRCFIEINAKQSYFGVCFLDPQLNVNLEYLFGQPEAGKIFLQQVTSRKFLPLDNSLSEAEITYFDKLGKVTIQHTDMLSGKITEKVATGVDLQMNWEDIPEFGKYESITRKER